MEVRYMVVVMLVDLIGWLAVGALTGWLASRLLRLRRREAVAAYLLLGVLGALLAVWFVVPWVTPHAADRPAAVDALAVAALGAAALVLAVHGLAHMVSGGFRRRRWH